MRQQRPGSSKNISYTLVPADARRLVSVLTEYVMAPTKDAKLKEWASVQRLRVLNLMHNAGIATEEEGT